MAQLDSQIQTSIYGQVPHLLYGKATCSMLTETYHIAYKNAVSNTNHSRKYSFP